MGLLDRLLHHYHSIGSLTFALLAPTWSSGTSGSHFSTNLDAWAQLSVVNRFTASEGGGSVFLGAFGINACPTSFQLITSRAKGARPTEWQYHFIRVYRNRRQR